LKLLNRENEKEWLALYQLWESVITGHVIGKARLQLLT